MIMAAKLSDLICFVIGPFITIGSLLGFVYHFDVGLGLREKATYFYPISLSAATIGLGIGVSLICLGILIRYRRKHASPDETAKDGL
jgi:hypothetical protein